MASINFIANSTIIPATWLNDVNTAVYGVKSYGAVGDGSTDDYAAIVAAFAAASGGGIVYFPPGTYYCSSRVTVSSSSGISVVGAGPNNTIILWPNGATGGGGFNLTFTNILKPHQVSGLWLQSAAVLAATGVGTALLITGPEQTVVPGLTISAMVSNVVISSSLIDTLEGWNNGVVFAQCFYPVLQDVSIKGFQGLSYSPFKQTTGVILQDCQAAFLERFTIVHVETGILETSISVPALSRGEGFTMQSFEIVGCSKGIDLTADAINPGSGSNIGPGHINVNDIGITLRYQYQTKIHDMLLYQTQTKPNANYIGILLDSCKSNHVHDNEIEGTAVAGTGSVTGIQLGDSLAAGNDYNNIHDNQCRNFYNGTRVGIVIGSNVANCTFRNNTAEKTGLGAVTTPILLSSAGAGNQFSNNSPTSIQTLTANSTTPSVDNDLSNRWTTANTLATTITALTGGFVGQLIQVRVNDANTTFGNGANLDMQGGINFAPGSGAIVTFECTAAGGVFREVSRRT